MRKTIITTLTVICSICTLFTANSKPIEGRWSEEKANEWYAELPWLVGANFVPSTAINQLEMWQGDTFDPITIDHELGWAAAIGMNTMRVYLHDIPYFEDAHGFLNRIDHFLEIADRHHVKIMFVIFDGVWHPEPKPGLQPEPTPHRHNSGWVQSPGKAILADPKLQDELKPYVQDLMKRFGQDDRVLVWDLFNEPDNMIHNSYGVNGSNIELPREVKHAKVYELLEKTFEWAREMKPSQPLTAGIWGMFDLENLKPIEELSLDQSDVISFHCYENPEIGAAQVKALKKLNRPLFCTEYMARGNDCKFEDFLPLYYQNEIAAYNWGLVNGKSQTIYPWDSWTQQYDAEPELWFHDVFRKDGTPYDNAEVKLIKRLSTR